MRTFYLFANFIAKRKGRKRDNAKNMCLFGAADGMIKKYITEVSLGNLIYAYVDKTSQKY